MIGALLVSTIEIRAALAHIDAYCRALKCPKPVVVSIWPDGQMVGTGATTKRIEGGAGCAIHLRGEALLHVDWLAHEACHCANDYDRLDPRGWRPGMTPAERKLREDLAVKCSQGLLEREHAAEAPRNPR